MAHSGTSVEETLAGLGRLALSLVRTLAVCSVVIFLPGAVQRIRRMQGSEQPTCSPALVVLFAAVVAQLLVDPGDALGRLFAALPSAVAPEDALLLVNDAAAMPLHTFIVVAAVGFTVLAAAQLLLMRSHRSTQRAWGLWVVMHMVAALAGTVAVMRFAPSDSDSWAALVGLVLCLPSCLEAGAAASRAYRRWRQQRAGRVMAGIAYLLGAVLGMAAALSAVLAIASFMGEVGEAVRRAVPKKQGEGMRAAVAHGGHVCANVNSAAGRITCRLALLPRTDKTLLVWSAPPVFATLSRSEPQASAGGGDGLRLAAVSSLPALRDNEFPLQIRKDLPLIVDIQMDLARATCRQVNLQAASKHVVTVEGVYPVGTHELVLPTEQLEAACAAAEKARGDRKPSEPAAPAQRAGTRRS